MNNLELQGTSTITGGEYDQFTSTGIATITSGVTCNEIKVSGICTIQGDLAIHNRADVEGILTVTGGCEVEDCEIRGTMSVEGDMKAGKIHADGNCGVVGDLHADEIDMHFEFASGAKQVFADTIHVRRGKTNLMYSLYPEKFISKFLTHAPKKNFRAELVEGKTIDLEWTIAEVVRGDSVVIGEGCEIGTVEYRNELVLHDGAAVGKQVKTG